ncbi:GNAT family N-acetyltransferase [Nostoc sp. CCY 9925]|uniref:GNAT family N-acetyltransferase n=1 Tax=Nostoc sp. CCY 9925 TaxID=3103865 RepID=UPI0039C685FC
MIDFSLLNYRAVSLQDENFLFELYASTRAEELDAWGWNQSQREAFLQMQFKAQRWSYQMNFPKAEHQIVEYCDRPIGSILVDRTLTEILLVAIALLPKYRNQGIGTRLIQTLLDEATQNHQIVKLQVIWHNPAFHLYQRLGFYKTGHTASHIQMEWQLSKASSFNISHKSISSKS